MTGITDLTTVLNADITATLANSIEIEKHNHNFERWLGLAAVPNAEVHRADRIVGPTFPAVFQIDAGNLDWGAWVQVLGSGDTPVIAGMAKFDFHRLLITASERTLPYLIEIAFGATAAGALAANTFTEFVYKPSAANNPEPPSPVMSIRQNVGTKVWVRCCCPTQNTATLDFFIGLHEYTA